MPVLHLINFGEAIKLGGTALVGYTFLFIGSLSPPVCLLYLSVLISWFFNWWLSPC